MFKSVRVRLAFSFGAIALLVALSLGAVLLWIVQNYYSQMERSYLNSNAMTLSLTVEDLYTPEVTEAVRSAQLQNYAFLTQTRIRLLDVNQQVFEDTGVVQKSEVTLGVVKTEPMSFTSTVTSKTAPYGPAQQVFMYVAEQDSSQNTMVVRPSTATASQDASTVAVSAADPDGNITIISSLALQPTVYGFQFGNTAYTTLRRSAETATQAVIGANGAVVGFIRLSDGPAYGQEIWNNVFNGWLVASAFAVLLAFGVGWLMSQRISAPIHDLTIAAEQMYAGDLSARVTYRSADDLGRLSTAFNAMSEQLGETIDTLRRFVMDAAHELQTPLTALRTNLDLMWNEPSAEKRADYVRQAQTQVERLSRLTTSLLDLSRLETGQGREHFETLDLKALLCEISEPFAARAEQADQVFELDLPEQACKVMGSAPKLRSAVSNLLDNALKFTPAGGRVVLRLLEQDAAFHVLVSDTGIGFPPQEAALLFHRFHRGRNASLYPGSGLGLAIVQAVALAHGGWVTAAVNPQGGACFTMTLPIEQPENFDS